jgi:hypothetical protein
VLLVTRGTRGILGLPPPSQGQPLTLYTCNALSHVCNHLAVRILLGGAANALACI